MNEKTRTTVLQMVISFVVIILLVQLWLFTEALDAVHAEDPATGIAATVISGLGCFAVWGLIRFFLNAEKGSK